MNFSAHNVLKGKVSQISMPEGPICEVTMQTQAGEHIKAAISKARLKSMELEIGKEAYLIIKSLDVMLATD